MKTVSIYIMTGHKSPSITIAALGYVLEYVTSENKPVTRSEFINKPDTANGAATTALQLALRRIKQPCTLAIYMDNTYVALSLQKWMYEWAQNEWKGKKGGEIKHLEQWKEIFEISKNMTIEMHIRETHQYYDWMVSEIKRRR